MEQRKPPRIRAMAPLIATMDTRSVPVAAREPDGFYGSTQHREWRDAVVRRAGGRCQAMDGNGQRCTKAEPGHRMFADHINERRDGGDPFDLKNGQCLCGKHHTLKTVRARADRLSKIFK